MKQELLGKEFGRLMVIDRAESRKGRAYWLCRCVCSSVKIVRQGNLLSGQVRSCGCLARLQDRVGQRFGDLVVLAMAGRNKNGQPLWHCKCDCGKERTVQATNLIYGDARSCGCKNALKVGAEKFRVSVLGKKFGRLTIIRWHDIASGRQSRFLCGCECGRQVVVRWQALRTGKTQSCGCILLEKQKGATAPVNRLLKIYRKSAKERSLPFELSADDITTITSSDCYYCGCKPSQSLGTSVSQKFADFVYNGVDRLDSNLGYTLNNCVPACRVHNVMKWELSLPEFKRHILLLASRIQQGAF